MKLLRREWGLLSRWTTEDWMWVCLLVGWTLAARMAIADTPPAQSPHVVPWPEIEWRVTLGNVGTILAVAWWVGRWGAKQVALLDHLPQSIDALTRRIDDMEHNGCGQLREHRRLLALLRQHGIDPGITIEGDKEEPKR